jgi:hypothetical protein
VSGLPALIRVSVIIFIIVCKVQLSGQLFVPLVVKIYFLKLFCYIILAMSRQNRVRKLDSNFAVGCGPGTDYP